MTILASAPISLHELFRHLDVEIQGSPDTLISGIAPIQSAEQGQIAFLANAHYSTYLVTTKASAVILAKKFSSHPSNAQYILAKNPYYTYAKIAHYFAPQSDVSPGILQGALIGVNGNIDPSASIGPNSVIGNQVSIAKNVKIGPGCVIGDHCHISADVTLDANVTLYSKVSIGARSHISSGAIIGARGFGFATEQGVWHAVPQLGGVTLGEDVDIGANTTIDCGALDDTIIGNGVKLDNLIQIGHNVRIGDHTLIAGCTAIAGSTEIGAHCLIGGACMIAGHLKIVDQVVIAGGTGVMRSIMSPGTYAALLPIAMPAKESHRHTARIYRLAELMDRVKSLELQINAMQQTEGTTL